MKVNKISSIVALLAVVLTSALQQGVIPMKYAMYAYLTLHVIQTLCPSAVANSPTLPAIPPTTQPPTATATATVVEPPATPPVPPAPHA